MTAEPVTREHPLAAALVGEVATVMSAMIGGAGTATPAAAAPEARWTVTVTIGPPTPGFVTVGFADAVASQLVRAVLGNDEEPEESAVLDMLQEVMGQAVGGLRETPGGKGVLFCVEAPSRTAALPSSPGQPFTLSLTAEFSPAVNVWSGVESPAAAAPAPAAAAPSPLAVVPPPPVRETAPGVPGNLDVILDIDLPLSVRFGQTELTLEALTKLGPGSVIDLARSPDDPVDVLVNGRLVGHGEVVVVGGNYGVRITEILSAADRVRSLGQRN
jgi:flagellar motor switch protein FliN/FliY